MHVAFVTWGIAALATLGIVFRPWRLPEYLWAISGAALLLLFNLMSVPDALAAAAKGADVYLFLIGMMLLAELARAEGLFDFLAALAVRQAQGSANRLFLIVYVVGTLVTIFLSNDATAVVLTPAVYAAAQAARVNPLPYLFICAFIANAASFVLPISNPANLVIYGAGMPPLPVWLAHLGPPALTAIVATFVVLRLAQGSELATHRPGMVDLPKLSLGGWLVAAGIILTAIVLLTASAVGLDLGLPTFVAGLAVAVALTIIARRPPLPILRDISWGVLPLVAGLFILVDAVAQTGAFTPATALLRQAATTSPAAAAAFAGATAAVVSNLINNLPMGLIAASVSHAAQVPPQVTEGLLIGVDLGPNLSVTGSLATILWLIALRREGVQVSAWQFLRLGLIVMPPAMILALLALLVLSH